MISDFCADIALIFPKGSVADTQGAQFRDKYNSAGRINRHAERQCN